MPSFSFLSLAVTYAKCGGADPMRQPCRNFFDRLGSVVAVPRVRGGRCLKVDARPVSDMEATQSCGRLPVPCFSVRRAGAEDGSPRRLAADGGAAVDAGAPVGRLGPNSVGPNSVGPRDVGGAGGAV